LKKNKKRSVGGHEGLEQDEIAGLAENGVTTDDVPVGDLEN